MRPIPVAFHIWFLEVHTYGIGLAITFWFGLRYLERRLRRSGYPWQWVTGMFLWVIVAAIVGARAMHVIANFGYYSNHPGQIIAIWQGGLSSFGGLIAAIPVGIISARRRCPQIPIGRLADLVAPVLIASWSLGRLLGPQLMRAGGGHPTHQWFGMYYAGQVGKRLPVPIFQAALTFAVLLIVWQVERYARRHDLAHGLVIAVAAGFWGLNRSIEEHLWLAYPGHAGALAVQAIGLVLCAAGFGTAGVLLRRSRPGRRPGRVVPEPGPPVAPGRPAPITTGAPAAGGD